MEKNDSHVELLRKSLNQKNEEINRLKKAIKLLKEDDETKIEVRQNKDLYVRRLCTEIIELKQKIEILESFKNDKNEKVILALLNSLLEIITNCEDLRNSTDLGEYKQMIEYVLSKIKTTLINQKYEIFCPEKTSAFIVEEMKVENVKTTQHPGLDNCVASVLQEGLIDLENDEVIIKAQVVIYKYQKSTEKPAIKLDKTKISNLVLSYTIFFLFFTIFNYNGFFLSLDRNDCLFFTIVGCLTLFICQLISNYFNLGKKELIDLDYKICFLFFSLIMILVNKIINDSFFLNVLLILFLLIIIFVFVIRMFFIKKSLNIYRNGFTNYLKSLLYKRSCFQIGLESFIMSLIIYFIIKNNFLQSIINKGQFIIIISLSLLLISVVLLYILNFKKRINNIDFYFCSLFNTLTFLTFALFFMNFTSFFEYIIYFLTILMIILLIIRIKQYNKYGEKTYE